jgi:bifunctional enzyme CysN/CysC
VVVGHVDHGKSTLLGRVMLDCGRVADDRVAHVTKICQEKALQFEPAFLFDALEEEQEQGISIDTTRVNFEFEGKKLVLIDAPGHLEFLKNMTSGASEAEVGILVVDCNQGIRSQTERHLKILGVLGIRTVLVALNKIDQVGYSQDVFEKISAQIREVIQDLQLNCEDVVPVSALLGENITCASERLMWYAGKPLLSRLLELVDQRTRESKVSQPLRMVLQDVYRFGGERRFVGRVLTGTVKPGDEIFFSPSGKISKIEAIERFPHESVNEAIPGDSVALRLSEQVFVERGEVISHRDNVPEVDTEFRARIAWLSKHVFAAESEYIIKVGTNEAECKLRIINEAAEKWASTQEELANGGFSDVVVKLSKQIAFDRAITGLSTEQFVLCTTFETVAVGTIDKRPVRSHHAVKIDPNLRLEAGYIERGIHEGRNGHRGSVLWLTGLSGAGKSTLAKAIEKELFRRDLSVVVLDGDNLRHGLCADLGFSPDERSENIRRIAHCAKLFLNRGFIVVTACISPFERDREVAREIVGAADLQEIFVFCPFEECQRRDPKGLYSKAAAGTVKAVTGFDSPYQPPSQPALRLDSSSLSIEQEVEAVLELLASKKVVPSTVSPPAQPGAVASPMIPAPAASPS